jgi:hypothetical protein
MTATQMTATQMQRFVTICEDQGIRVTRTKKGLLLRFPDGTSTVQHFTNSDSRAMANQISRFRRAGMVHPNDTRRQKESLPAYITSGTISKKTKQRIVELIEQLGYPDAVLSSTVVKETGMDPGWANRALYHSGFRPGPAKNKRVGRPWYTPEDILELKDKPKADEAAETPMSQEDSVEIPEPVEVPDPMDVALAEILTEAEDEHEEAIESEGSFEEPEPASLVADPAAYPPSPEAYVDTVPRETSLEPEPAKPRDREFLDSHESWVVSLEELLGYSYRTVEEKLSVLGVLGLEYEFRVWRKG